MMRHRTWIIAALTFAVGSSVRAELTAPPNGEMGFVVGSFGGTSYPVTDESCPDGRNGTIRENFLASLPVKEQERLQRRENDNELDQLWKRDAVNAKGIDVCTGYDQFPDRRLLKTVKGKIAYGMNLDGDKTDDPYVCAHETFTSPSGEPGIDNQAYRATGCRRPTADEGTDAAKSENNANAIAMRQVLAEGSQTIVIILRGVDSLLNDDKVEVILATSPDSPYLDTNANFQTQTTFTVGTNPRWRNVLSGRIVDGTLITASKDIVLRRNISVGGARGQRAEWEFDRAQLRLTFQADGTLLGQMGGYQPLLSFIQIPAYGGRGSALTAGIDCAATYTTMRKLADGRRDPATGECKAISSVVRMKAVQAYVFDRPPENRKTADLAGSAE